MKHSFISVFLLLMLPIQIVLAFPPLVVDYRMDECYFLDGANGSAGDVFDSSLNAYHASSVNRLDSNESNPKICRSGIFGDNGYARVDTPFTLGEQWSLSVWIHFPFIVPGHRYYILGSYTGEGDLPVFQNNNGTLEWGIYDNSQGLSWKPIGELEDGWHHLVFKNRGNLGSNNRTILFVDGIRNNPNHRIDRVTSGEVSVLWTSTDDFNGQSIASNIDEMKIFSGNLTTGEISDIYNYENAGNNYDGSPRLCKSCTGSDISANSWDLVGIPAETRLSHVAQVTVNDIFGSMTGVFGTDWNLYKRVYSDTDNSSSYELLGLDNKLEFGQGYWLGSLKDDRWDVDGSTSVFYDSVLPCTKSECVEVVLTSVTTNFDIDGDDGSGPYRYNMGGFVGIDRPVDWADCRFIISDLDGTSNLEILTPTEAEAAGYAARQIWQYNGTGDTASNSYNTCDDSGTSTCKLIPFKGFWIELHGASKDKLVKLQIPKG